MPDFTEATVLKKLAATLAALAVFVTVDATTGGLLLLWIYWHPLSNLALRSWDDFMVDRTRNKFRKDGLSAQVDAYYVHRMVMMNHRGKNHDTC
jgi:hypothetical protein